MSSSTETTQDRMALGPLSCPSRGPMPPIALLLPAEGQLKSHIREPLQPTLRSSSWQIKCRTFRRNNE